MANERLLIDSNHKNCAGAVTDDAAQEIRNLRIDDTTKALKVMIVGGAYTLPIATASVLGGIKVGTGLSIDAGTGVLTATGGSGTVTTVSVATANGFSGTVANATSTPAITIIAGAITPTSVNGLTITANGTNTLNITAGKTLTVQDNVTITGALGTAAYTASTAYATSAQGTLATNAMPIGGGTFTGTVALGENSFQLDPAISADGKWSGITETGTAGSALTFGQLCYYNSSNKWVVAKADSATTSTNKLGICILAAGADTNPTEMLLYGKVNAATAFPTLTVGAPVYISGATGGAIVTAQPTTTDYVIRIIGYGNTSDELFFTPSNEWMTHI